MTILIFSANEGIAADPSCHPFQVYRNAPVPPAPPAFDVPKVFEEGWEGKIAADISSVKGEESFSNVYFHWRAEHAGMKAKDRFLWLKCLDYYVHLDWSAISDNAPASVLYPRDFDARVWDGAPRGEIPKHIRFSEKKRPAAARYQRELFNEFGILAIDHTDTHSPAVLKELLYILRSTKQLHRSYPGLKYVYAFAGHDTEINIAAYHVQAHALSIGGMSSYPAGPLKPDERVNLLLALGHELGHAFIFEKLTPEDLRFAGQKWGGWKLAPDASHDFYGLDFFKHAPEAGVQNDVSTYARKNVHEWFAEAFSVAVVSSISADPVLRASRSLHTMAGRLSKEFVKWIAAKMH